jgi:ABC-type Na+ transport system ATPase subunit NatA
MNMKRRLKKRVRKNWRVMKMFMNHLPKKKKVLLFASRQLQEVNLGVKNWITIKEGNQHKEAHQ